MDAKLREKFVSKVLPVVVAYTRKAFSGCDADRHEEFVAEATAAAFVSFSSLVKRGREAKVTPKNLAYFACKHVRDDRRVGGSSHAQDALTPRSDVTVTRFGHLSDLPKVLHDALADNTRSPVPEQAAFRIDFPQFLENQPERKREVATLLAQGHRGTDVARRVGLSRARVTQIRQELGNEWAAAST